MKVINYSLLTTIKENLESRQKELQSLYESTSGEIIFLDKKDSAGYMIEAIDAISNKEMAVASAKIMKAIDESPRESHHWVTQILIALAE
jgi:hypothetical protein